MKIQEATSNVAITEKNEQYVRLQLTKYTRTQLGDFQIKLPLILMVLLMVLLVPCDVQVVKNTFVDDSKPILVRNLHVPFLELILFT